MMLRPVLVVVACLAALADAGISGALNLQDQGAQVRISFAVESITDVTVDVLDSGGSVIRHLAAGMLGPNPPLPLVADSLAQVLYWDKRDDLGRPLSGPYRVRVRTGMTARFDRFYGSKPAGNVNTWLMGLAVDTNGDVAGLMKDFHGEVYLSVFGRDGSYKRTLLPYADDQPEEKLKGFGRLALSDGRKVPVMYQGHRGTFLREFHYPYRQDMTVSPQGWLVMSNTPGGAQYYGFVTRTRRAIIMGMDGTCPRDSLFGPVFKTGYGGWDPANFKHAFLAVSPDGNTLYEAGLDSCVRRGPLNSQAQLDPYICSGVSQPRGMALDLGDRLYVCDSLQNYVYVFDASGQKLDSIPKIKPNLVKVNRRTGDLYVMTLDMTTTFLTITKYTAYPALDSVCALRLTYATTTNFPTLMALDDHAVRPILWVGNLSWSPSYVSSFQDTGTGFQSRTEKIFDSRQINWAGATISYPGYIAVDPAEQVLYAGNNRWSKVNLATGVLSASPIRATELEFGPDRTIYAQSPGGISDSQSFRYNINEQRIAFGNGQTVFYGPVQYNWGASGYGTRGFTVSRDGRFYIQHAGCADPRASTGVPGDTGNNKVTVYDSSLNLLTRTLIDVPNASGGIQVDLKGNAYIAYNTKPKGVVYHDPAWNTQLPDPLALIASGKYGFEWAGNAYLNYYLFLVGSIYKFPPTGGVVGFVPGNIQDLSAGTLDGDSVPAVQANGDYYRCMSVNGPVWQHPGVAPAAAFYYGRGDQRCVCFAPRFTVDDYGRVFYADAYRFCVGIIDNNRNKILEFGDYGNVDQLGEGSARPNPAIPFGYPVYVRQVNNSVYVSDVGNRRIVKVNLVYEDSALSAGGLNAGAFSGMPEMFTVRAYPSPFNPVLNIECRIDRCADADIRIYSTDGSLVFSRRMGGLPPGRHVFKWAGNDFSGRGLAAGAYFIRVKAGGKIRETKALLIR